MSAEHNDENIKNNQNQPVDNGIERPANQTIVLERKSSSLGLFAMIIGILSLLTFSCCGPLSIILAITAIITGIIARTEKQEYATIGLILGVLGLILPLMLLLLLTGFTLFSPLFGNLF